MLKRPKRKTARKSKPLDKAEIARRFSTGNYDSKGIPVALKRPKSHSLATKESRYFPDTDINNEL